MSLNQSKSGTNALNIDPGGKSLLSGFFNWIFGTAQYNTSAMVHFPKSPPDVLMEPKLDPKLTIARPMFSSWGAAFKNGITDATSQFIRDHISCFSLDDETLRYSLTRLVAYFDGPIVRQFESMPSSMWDTQGVKCFGKATNAYQLLTKDFRGISFESPDTMADDPWVETTICAGGDSVKIKFHFDGGYVYVDEAPKVEEEPAPVPDLVRITESDTTVDRSAPSVASVAMTSALDKAQGHDVPTTAHEGLKTTTNSPSAPLRRPVARLYLQARGHADLVALYADDFPYTIGRHENGVGFAVVATGESADHALSLLSAADDLERAYNVALKHLVLHKFDPVCGVISVENCAAVGVSSGTFELKVKGGAKHEVKGQRFLYDVENPVWLGLGTGMAGGRLEIKVEAA